MTIQRHSFLHMTIWKVKVWLVNWYVVFQPANNISNFVHISERLQNKWTVYYRCMPSSISSICFYILHKSLIIIRSYFEKTFHKDFLYSVIDNIYHDRHLLWYIICIYACMVILNLFACYFLQLTDQNKCNQAPLCSYVAMQWCKFVSSVFSSDEKEWPWIGWLPEVYSEKVQPTNVEA